MIYKGHVHNGMLVLDEPVTLTEGTRVRIEVLHAAPSEPLHPEIVRFTGVLPSDIDVRAGYTDRLGINGETRRHRAASCSE